MSAMARGVCALESSSFVHVAEVAHELRDASNSVDDPTKGVNGVANVPLMSECPPVPMERGSVGVTWEKNADKESSAHASEYRSAGTSLCKAV